MKVSRLRELVDSSPSTRRARASRVGDAHELRSPVRRVDLSPVDTLEVFERQQVVIG